MPVANDSLLALFRSGQSKAAISHVFAFCLFGSVFIQPRPAALLVAMALLMIALVAFSADTRSGRAQVTARSTRLIWIPFVVWFCAHVVIAALHSPFAWNQLANPLRALLALGPLLYLILFPASARYLWAGLALACVAAFGHAAFEALALGTVRATGWFNNPIYYGDYCGLLGIFAIIVGLLARDLRAGVRITFLALGFLASVAAAASGTRTALLPMLCLAPLLVVRPVDDLHRHLRNFFLMVIAALVFGLAVSERARDRLRITEAVSDFKAMAQGKAASSIGDRKEMWKAAIGMAKTAPVFGVGLNGFEPALAAMVQKKEILALSGSYNQAHSQALQSLAAGGAFLLSAYVVYLLGPLLWFWLFFKRSVAAPGARLMAYLGMTHVASHAIFGLTVATFDIQVFSSLYCITVVALAAFCISEARISNPVLNPPAHV